jgi:hypothetical protein
MVLELKQRDALGREGFGWAESQAKYAASNHGWGPVDKVRPNLYKRVFGWA